MIDEFRGAPTWVNSGLDERPQYLDMDGNPVTKRAPVEEPAKPAADKPAAKPKP